LMTQAAADKGVDRLVESIAKHGDYLGANRDAAREAERRTHELIEVLSGELEDRTVRSLKAGREDGLLSSVRAGQLNPYGAARRILEDPDKIIELLAIGKNGTHQ
jgi:putative protein kinase ArgK-like GTPase of G3E family